MTTTANIAKIPVGLSIIVRRDRPFYTVPKFKYGTGKKNAWGYPVPVERNP